MPTGADILSMVPEPPLLAAIRKIVREELAAKPVGARVESMTVDEFAYVVRLHRETVLLKIRRRSIDAKHVSRKAKAYRIRPAALEAFGVSPEEAAARLAEFRALHPRQSSPQSQA